MLYEQDADATGIKKADPLVRRHRQVLTADDFGVEPLATVHVTDRNSEMRNSLDFNHDLLPHDRRQHCSNPREAEKAGGSEPPVTLQCLGFVTVVQIALATSVTVLTPGQAANSKAALAAAYGAVLRVSEVVALKVSDIV